MHSANEIKTRIHLLKSRQKDNKRIIQKLERELRRVEGTDPNVPATEEQD